MTAQERSVDRERVKRLFASALELDEGARDPFLVRECGDDAALREEVQTLLSHHHGDTVLDVARSDPTAPKILSKAPDPESTGGARRLRRSTWLAIAGCAIVSIFAIAVHRVIEATTRDHLRAQLESALESSDVAVALVLDALEEHAAATAENPLLRAAVESTVANPSASPAELTRLLDTFVRKAHLGAGVVRENGVVIATSSGHVANRVGARLNPEGLTLLGRARDLRTPILKMPFAAGLLIEGGVPSPGEPVFSVVAPLFSEAGGFLGGVFFAADPSKTLSALLVAARAGETVEAYAFDARGVLLTGSRFDAELRRGGRLPDEPSAHSALRVRLLDPGVDLRRGKPSSPLVDDRPLTRLVSAAISGVSGVDLDGYRGYLGSRVIGAWRWHPEHEYGVAVEMHEDEAYRALAELRTGGFAFVVLLALAIAYFVRSSHVESRLGSELARAERFGSYRLVRRLGAGGMGEVWLARHAMLSRPVALKLIKREFLGADASAATAAFQREVELTSRLTHPNVIAIHDFGVAATGELYYVMEYVEGVDLKRLVTDRGPLEPKRVAHIVREVCAALAEAHDAGLIHRDIKASNVMLCRRGGIDDSVELLDFGLVIERTQSSGDASRAGFVAGTPSYIAPERWLDPASRDPRGDLYAVGVLAYFLLTARLPFGGESGQTATGAKSLVQRILEEPPPQLSLYATFDVPKLLSDLVTDLLAKDPAKRPSTAAEVIARLSTVVA